MSGSTAQELIAQIVGNQKKKPARHQLSVAFTALGLARIHAADPEQVFMAAMMHDIAKKVPPDLARAYLDSLAQNTVEPLDAFERNCDDLLHGAVAAKLMTAEYGIADEAVLAAVRYHSTGHPAMNPAGQILMIADYCEPLRPWTEEARRILSLAEKDLKAGYTEVLKTRHQRHIAAGIEPHPRSLEALRMFEGAA